ncbi:MAG: hypothetical protein MUC93_13845 [Bacteroidales bacterium]|jgi:hypothetical protein|nr:hypothetical protein [Bacteroidales bacterium]
MSAFKTIANTILSVILFLPVKGTIRFEHFAYNTPDQESAALWLVEFMDLHRIIETGLDSVNI